MESLIPRLAVRRRMRLLAALVLVAVLVAGCASNSSKGDPPAARTCTSTLSSANTSASPHVVLDTSQGVIRLTLFCDKAPLTGQQIVKLVEKGCYDGTQFHRVVRGFMDQGGDPLSKDATKAASWGTGGPSDCGVEPDTIAEEFYCQDGTISQATPSQYEEPSQCDGHGGLGLKHDGPGVWSMARTNAPHSSGSQFFLTAAAASFLDGRYTVFGHAADQASTDVILKINNLPCSGRPCADPPQGSSRTDTPVVIRKATVEWS